MLIESIAAFLGVSVLFYCLFAGADFGAGILEVFSGQHRKKEQQELITHAIGPVWEANHVWLILAVVILFNGFPMAYSVLATVFHIPLVLVLIGVILRGCAFTFRHYDAVRDGSQKYYTLIFKISSVLTPLMLGVISGAMLLGRLGKPEQGFLAVYVWPWLNVFSFSVGVFTCVLFAFLAAVYLTGEAKDKALRRIFATRALVLNGAAVLAGGLVFFCAYADGLPLAPLFLKDAVSFSCMVLATVSLVPLWLCLKHGKVTASRVLAAAQMLFILLGWFKLQFPVIIASRTLGKVFEISLYNAAAPTLTLAYLLYSLIVGSLVIFPALYFLMRVFKSNSF